MLGEMLALDPVQRTRLWQTWECSTISYSTRLRSAKRHEPEFKTRIISQTQKPNYSRNVGCPPTRGLDGLGAVPDQDRSARCQR